jgi:hypothetical protein
MRHWRQQFNRNAEFIFTRSYSMDGDTVLPAGSVVPAEVKADLSKLRALWHARRIELAPTQKATAKHLGGGWYEVVKQDGTVEKVHGRQARDQLMEA